MQINALGEGNLPVSAREIAASLLESKGEMPNSPSSCCHSFGVPSLSCADLSASSCDSPVAEGLIQSLMFAYTHTHIQHGYFKPLSWFLQSLSPALWQDGVSMGSWMEGPCVSEYPRDKDNNPPSLCHTAMWAGHFSSTLPTIGIFGCSSRSRCH